MNSNVDIKAMLARAENMLDHGQIFDAKSLYIEILKYDEVNAEAYFLYGVCCAETGSIDEAILSIEKSISLNSNDVDAYFTLGTIFQNIFRIEDAVDCLKNAVELDADYAEAWELLGVLYEKSGDIDNAVIALKNALSLNNGLVTANECLNTINSKSNSQSLSSVDDIFKKGLYAAQQGDFSKAEEAFNKVLSIDPHHLDTLSNLGRVYCHIGKIEKSIALFNEVVITIDSCETAGISDVQKRSLEDLKFQMQSNIVFFKNYLPDYNAFDVFSTHKEWGDLFCKNDINRNFVSADNNKIRIAFISPDFKRHSVAYFIEPILKNFNDQIFDVICYADVKAPDEITDRLKTYNVTWVDISHLSDKDVIGIVLNDNIDILIDLAGHTTNNRLRIFSQRIAPVQITYLGYPNTTGIKAMDYRIVDAITDPVGLTDSFYTEKLLRINSPFICFMPPESAPDVNDSPAIVDNCVTFGSFNALTKMNASVISVWADILNLVKNSRLLLKNPGFNDQYTCERVLNEFVEHGIERSRVELISFVSSYTEHLQLYNKIDIALDTFPYNGTTTTCEALWMGVPVITLLQSHHAGRVGGSLLTSVGLQQLVACNLKQYVSIAASLASDIDQLQDLRINIRTQLKQSRLCDDIAFTNDFEVLLSDVWSAYLSNTNLAGGFSD